MDKRASPVTRLFSILFRSNVFKRFNVENKRSNSIVDICCREANILNRKFMCRSHHMHLKYPLFPWVFVFNLFIFHTTTNI